MKTFSCFFATLLVLLPIIKTEAIKGAALMTDINAPRLSGLPSFSTVETRDSTKPNSLSNTLDSFDLTHPEKQAGLQPRKNNNSLWAGSSPLAFLVSEGEIEGAPSKSKNPVKIEIDLSKPENLSGLGLKSEQREMDTPAYLEKKLFTGYRLADVLNSINPELKALKAADKYKVTFVCADGYQAVAATAKGITPLSAILSGNDFVATGIGATGKWDVVNEGTMAEKNVTPAPLYIMGDSIVTEAWPLMVVMVVIEKME